MLGEGLRRWCGAVLLFWGWKLSEKLAGAEITLGRRWSSGRAEGWELGVSHM